MHVIQPEAIRPFLPHRVRSLLGVTVEPPIYSQLHRVVSEREARWSGRVRPAGVFPLRLRRQTVALPVPVRNPDIFPVDLIERLPTLLLAELVGELDRVQPGNLLNWIPVGRLARDPFLASTICGEVARIVAHHSFILRLGDFVNAQVEWPADPRPVR